MTDAPATYIDHLEEIRRELRQALGTWQIVYQRVIAIPRKHLVNEDRIVGDDRLTPDEFLGVAESCENSLIRLKAIVAREVP